MNPHLNHMIARQRCAELQREGEQARLGRELPRMRRSLRGPHPITESGRGTPALEAGTTIRDAR